MWENTVLSPRDRSLVTITSLISLYRINELPFHLKRALENGVTRDEIMDHAVEAGINFIDRAKVHGGPRSPDIENCYDVSEEIIGRWMAQGGRRDRIVLATKVYQPMGAGPYEGREISATARGL